jgi:hypothetical protein
VGDEHPSSGDSIAAKDFVIKVYVRELDQLFDSMDPSPFHEKDLDRNAHEYIVGAATEMSAGEPAALLVYLEKPAGLPDEAQCLGEAIRVYFARRADQARLQLRQRVRAGWIALAVGLMLLIGSVVVGQQVAQRLGAGPLATVVRESLLIGGWVAMWRPMDFFLYEIWILRGQLRVYEQLSRIAVRVVYTGKRDDGVVRCDRRQPAGAQA